MKRTAAIALLYAISSVPACAANDDNAYAELDPKTKSLDTSANETRRFIVERIESLSKVNLLQVNDSFSMYGKLSLHNTDNPMHRNATTYGFHAQLNSTSRIAVHLGLERCIAGRNSGDNLYSLTATVRF